MEPKALRARFRSRRGRQEQPAQNHHKCCRDAHRDEPRHRTAARADKFLRGNCLEMLEQLLAALVAQLERRGLAGDLSSGTGDGFAHQVDGVLQALVEMSPICSTEM